MPLVLICFQDSYNFLGFDPIDKQFKVFFNGRIVSFDV
ncbi:unnamed protein product [Brassica oleracea var. botrytis]